ncbi:hypothetical protein M011DRAFT_322292 [Sporormia fimetaria CBS 119925]|uniref:Low temperature requirement A n=1 Tax=Sporormia fimetaria CBS 119925 TaxID=1340428 RepID=A0A6A6VEJ7_9PLEO|nr:hypothetical protein M011DRAFT_322292 [Sporormia fimetaria CBS 119925]
MGFSLHDKTHRDVDAEKHLKRWHKQVPYMESPLRGADPKNLVFSQRHEANTVELFFDLFFVANLATFTTYHSVTDKTYLASYIGFFTILWSCWFQVTLHDVRFARDSVYERACKTVQFIVFVGLALVGSEFNPGGSKVNNTNFRVLCYTLIISRALLVVQYVVVFFYTARARYQKLLIPLGLMILIYAVAAVGFGVMMPSFRQEEAAHTAIYAVWYIIMLIESVAVITISCFWRMLSFKKTHLMERMSLLTLIVIGEGAIGITKTVSRMMGSGLDVEGCFLVMCIILIMVLLWALYFDNFPHGHYGTIRQQIWSVLHFPFQLAILGIVEGSQQVALARYVVKSYKKFDDSLMLYCFTQHLDGAALRDKLLPLVDYWQFDSKLETFGFGAEAEAAVYSMGNTTGICSAANTAQYLTTPDTSMPLDIQTLIFTMIDGIYRGLGIKLPVDRLLKETAIEIAVRAWKVVYLYYWSCFCILMACSIGFLFLIRRHRVDFFDFVSVITRMVALGLGAGFIAFSYDEALLYHFIASPAVLPTCMGLLFLVQFFGSISAAICNWQLNKSGVKYAYEHPDEHAHKGDHGEFEFNDPARDPLVPDHNAVAWSVHPARDELTAATAYLPPHADGHPMAAVSSPPRAQGPDASGYHQRYGHEPRTLRP